MKLGQAGERVLRTLLATGPATVPVLADELGLTQMGVRRQLDALLAADLVAATEKAPYGPSAPRGRGRPAKVFSVTASGREALSERSDDLATQALRFLADTAGEAAVVEFARRRAEQLVAPADRVAVGDARDRASVLATTLSDEGFATNIVEVAGGHAVQLCQHQCPVGQVASEFPQLCEAEAEAFSHVLGRHVTRLATLAHGDGICTTLVPVGADSHDETRPGTNASERTNS